MLDIDTTTCIRQRHRMWIVRRSEAEHSSFHCSVDSGTTMSSTKKVTFHLLASMASPKITRSVTVTLAKTATKQSILRLVSYLFGKVSLGFVDKYGRRATYDPSNLQSDCYVTEYACTEASFAPAFLLALTNALCSLCSQWRSF